MWENGRQLCYPCRFKLRHLSDPILGPDDTCDCGKTVAEHRAEIHALLDKMILRPAK
jgi:hypothetical protein